tara:strand:- start:7344 stop:7715 length:372 start_codon:yes stop_codon:yes gene_type:complete
MKIEVSNGEIVDKLTILLIKKEAIKNEDKLQNVQKEIDEIGHIADGIVARDSKEFVRLHNINRTLWGIEDQIREKERNRQFDDEFIQLARSVYFTNDERFKAKRVINELSGSNIFEEKSYEAY